MEQQKIQVVGKNVYLPRELEEHEKNSSQPCFLSTPDACLPTGPDMINYEIREDQYRLQFLENEGEICIAIQAGENLGEIYVNVQYEGAKGEWDRCMYEQNNLLCKMTGWLHEKISELSAQDAEWQVTIDSQPCPKSEIAPNIELAANILEAKQEIDYQQDLDMDIQQQL